MEFFFFAQIIKVLTQSLKKLTQLLLLINASIDSYFYEELHTSGSDIPKIFLCRRTYEQSVRKKKENDWLVVKKVKKKKKV